MKYKTFLFLILVSVYVGCSDSKNVEKTPSCQFHLKTTKTALNNFFKDHKEASRGEKECIDKFPDRFRGDSTKTGVRMKIFVAEGSFYFEEYTFSKQYLLDHAMEVTFAMMLYSKNWKHERVAMVENGVCLVFRTDLLNNSEMLEPYFNEIVDDYLVIKRK